MGKTDKESPEIELKTKKENPTMLIKYYIGQIIKRFGYKLVPIFKYPYSTINFVEIGYNLLKAQSHSALNIVQIGVFDGKISDPLQNVLNKYTNARVLLVEPQPKPFEYLLEMYGKRLGFTLINAAITDRDGTIKLYLPNAEEASPKASLSKSHFSKFSIKEKSLKSIEVGGITIKSLLNKYSFDTVDLLQIDTEGQDHKILKQFFNLNIFPKIINLESFHLDKNERGALRNDLTTNNYLYIDIEYDTFSVHKSLLKD